MAIFFLRFSLDLSHLQLLLHLLLELIRGLFRLTYLLRLLCFGLISVVGLCLQLGDFRLHFLSHLVALFFGSFFFCQHFVLKCLDFSCSFSL